MIRNYLAPWPDFDYPNLALFLSEVCERYASNTAIIMPVRSEQKDGLYIRWSFAELCTASQQVAHFFVASGIGRGDAVAVVSENRPEWIVTYFAALIAGAVIVPVDAGLDAQGIRTVLQESGTVLLVASGKQLARLETVAPFSKMGGVRHIVALDPRPAPDDTLSYARLMEQRWDGTLPDPHSILPDDAASIIYTSGATGLAKGVVLTHHGIIANANASILSLPIDQHDVFVGVLPFHHTYPTTCAIVSPLMVGASVSIVDRLAGTVIVSVIRDTGGTVLIGVPLLYEKIRSAIATRLRELPAFTRTVIRTIMTAASGMKRITGTNPSRRLLRSLRQHAGLGSLRLMVSGGGPLNPKTAHFFETLGFTIRQGYGMSENGPLISTNAVEYYDSRSIGLPVKYTDIRIAEPDRAGVGHIEVRSPSLMKGYHNNEEATREIMTEDGYLRTGDLGFVDRKGYLHIAGRNKNLIVTGGGKNVYPEEIEGYFADSSVIGEIVVIGVPNKSGEEEIVAVIHPNCEYLQETLPHELLTVEHIHDLVEEEVREVNKRLPGYKKISRFEIREFEFEKTSSKKIKRYLYTTLDECLHR